VLKPMLDMLFMSHFSHIAKRNKDYLLSEIFYSLNKDCRWHLQWSQAFIQMLMTEIPENKMIIMNGIKKWYPLASRAVNSFIHYFETGIHDDAKLIHSTLVQDYQNFLNASGLDVEMSAWK